MRVIAGEYGGRIIRAPKGKGTRPTTDRVRESLFSTLASARGGFTGAMVLDAFAGSGALGIEALSRGSGHAVFCEKDRSALKALEDNLSMVSPARFTLIAGDVTKRALSSPAPFDLVFLDPPYAMGARVVQDLLARLAREDSLAQGALVSYEHALEGESLDFGGGGNGLQWKLISHKTYGKSAIDLYQRR